MAEITGQNFPHKNPEFLKPKERLSDEEMGNLLSAIGNHEAKAITLILMRSGGIFGISSLDRLILSAQGTNKGWKMSVKVPFAYCRDSLSPIGLVAKETLNEDLSTFGYSITDYGREIGIPLAGLLLDFSEKYNLPLNLLFGATNSVSREKTTQTEKGKDVEYKKRSPSTTLKILYEILTSPNLPVSEADIARAIKEENSSALSRYLIRLSKLGLVEYNVKEINKPFSRYKLAIAIPGGELPMYKKHPTLTKSVFDVLVNYPDQYLTIQDIFNLLSKEQKEKWKNEGQIPSTISGILFFLAKHKYVDIEKFHGGKESEISIPQEQKIVLAELLDIMFRFQNEDKEILEQGRRLAEEIISNPQRVSNLLRRTKETSSNANQSPIEETQQMILSILVSHPKGLTTKEIQRLLEEGYGKKLGIGRINKLSSFLAGKDLIGVEKEKRVNMFFPNN